MLAMAAVRSAPMVRPAESPPAGASASALRLGVGVAGGAALCVEADWLGAAGTAGVLATGWAGVAGGAAAAGAGFSLGCAKVVLAARTVRQSNGGAVSYLVHHAHNETLLLNVVGADSLVILENFA